MVTEVWEMKGKLKYFCKVYEWDHLLVLWQNQFTSAYFK
jgi:hypothetical protein